MNGNIGIIGWENPLPHKRQAVMLRYPNCAEYLCNSPLVSAIWPWSASASYGCGKRWRADEAAVRHKRI